MVSAVVFIGGDAPEREVLARLPEQRFIVAADSGFDHTLALGVHVDLLVGDLDSISPDGLAAALAGGVEIERHRPDKDATDTELAIDAATLRGCSHVVVVSGGGDRFDHELGALMAVSRPSLRTVDIEAWWGRTYLRVLHGPATRAVAGAPDALLSLVPLHGDALGVTTQGLRYPLSAETLFAGSSRGISNEFLTENATVDVTEGTLLIVMPNVLAPTPDSIGDARP